MQEKYCQSCAMPMEEEFTSENEIYCIYCFENGAFTFDGTMEEMIELCLPYMVEAGMDPDEARGMMCEVLPTLERWKA